MISWRCVVALLERLEVDLDAPAVQRGVGAVDADEGGEALDRGILAGSRAPSACWRSRHRRERDRSRGASEMPRITPVSCTERSPSGTTMIEQDVSDQRRDGDQSVVRWCRSTIERPAVGRDHALEEPLGPGRSGPCCASGLWRRSARTSSA